ncbi:MAG TPA: type II toxin-antitoxin system VapC family toxin [Gemmataceae bacterium]|nr:type II toxin-antitoxin system VapC family toxin [Gemmataceae bacterium]
MSRLFVLDTDILSLWQHAHPAVSKHVAAHAADELAVTVITVQEQLDGWHARLSRAREHKEIADLYRRLADTVRFLSRVQIVSFSEGAIDRYEELRGLKLNIGKMDLRIAAIVLDQGATLVTRNTRDFARVPALQMEDWSA